MSSVTVTETKPEAGLIRRLAAETVGTFFLVTVAEGVGDLHPGEVSTATRAVAPGVSAAGAAAGPADRPSG